MATPAFAVVAAVAAAAHPESADAADITATKSEVINISGIATVGIVITTPDITNTTTTTCRRTGSPALMKSQSSI